MSLRAPLETVRRLAVGALACAATACTEMKVYDAPDASLAWPQHHTAVHVPDGGLGLVSNSLSDTLSLLDLAAAATIGNVRVGFDPIANDGPHHLAVDGTSGHVFVALSYPPPGVPSGPHAGHGTSSVPGWVQMLALDDLHEIARHQIDNNPGDIALTPDRRHVIVTHFDLIRAQNAARDDAGTLAAYSSLWILDAADLTRIASFPLCIAAHGIAISADGTRAYVACYGQDSLAIVHLDDPAYAVEQVTVGPGAGTAPSVIYGPYAVMLTHDGRYALVSDLGSTDIGGGDVRVFDIAAHQFVHMIPLRAAAYFAAESADGTYVLVPTQNEDGVARVRESDWSVAAFGRVPSAACVLPHEISRGPDGRFYVVCEGNKVAPGSVITVDPMTLTMGVNFPVGVYPDRVVFVTP